MPSSLIALCPSCPTPDPGIGHRCAVYSSSSVTDAQWAILEPLLPPPGNTTGSGGRPEKHCRRLLLDAILYVVRGGIAWRQLPAEFPPATTVYAIFVRWVRAGVWQRIHDALRDRGRVQGGGHPLPSAAIVDAQSVQGADTVPRSSRGYDARKKTNGRKRHIAVDSNGLLLAVVVTMAGIQDRDGAFRLLAALRAQFSTISLVWADGGYAGRLIDWSKRVVSLTVQVVKRTDDVKGFRVLPRRWVVERTFAWICKHRRCVRDYETRPDHHEAIVYIAMIATMSRRLARTA
ncbi:transposase (plasmid) [Rhodococcus jostii RHA1]|uniref:Transposase n=1 Tax=Rhodococcus jostii (strain RHA1) TaxID=101510 RepID=Q0RWF4_RHOJR|nr:transposase [Rhodococcus jostii RHA1]